MRSGRSRSERGGKLNYTPNYHKAGEEDKEKQGLLITKSEKPWKPPRREKMNITKINQLIKSKDVLVPRRFQKRVGRGPGSFKGSNRQR